MLAGLDALGQLAPGRQLELRRLQRQRRLDRQVHDLILAEPHLDAADAGLGVLVIAELDALDGPVVADAEHVARRVDLEGPICVSKGFLEIA